MVQITAADGNTIDLGERHRQVQEFTATSIVERISEVAEGVVELLLRRTDGRPWPDWAAGAHIDLLLSNGLTRQYSLCGLQDDPHVWRLGILREPGSRGGSSFVHGTVRPGSELRVRGPRNAFHLKEHDRYLFIAGGIGITPILAMIAEVNRRGKAWSLLYGGRTRASMAFVNELLETGGDVRIYPQDTAGFIPLAEVLGTPADGVGVYACGPGPMLNAIDSFREHWPIGAINMERFAVNEANLKHGDDRPIDLYLEASDITIQVGADETILAAVERNDIGVLSSCRVGTCGTCETSVVEGEPDHRDSVLDEEERARNDCMMICVSRARTRHLVLDL
jgi:ferredoxin-NADP reductase